MEVSFKSRGPVGLHARLFWQEPIIHNQYITIYNSKKSTVVVCRNKAMMNAVRPSFIVNGDVIPQSEKVKYIVHIICSDLK